MATFPREELLTVEEFLTFDFGPDRKVELDNGRIRMMAGASLDHDRVVINLIVAFGTRLRGSGCRPNTADIGVPTHLRSYRLPDVSIRCGQNANDDGPIGMVRPTVVIEILSPSTAQHDRDVKVPEYRALSSVETIALIDPDTEHMTVWQRTGRDPESWSEVHHTRPADLPLPTLGIAIPQAEIFARD